MPKIKVIDVSEVIKTPKNSTLIDGYPEAPHLKRTPENDKARANYWPISQETSLRNMDDARFKSLREALLK